MKLEESHFLISDYNINYYKGIVMNTGTKNRQVDEWNRVESPEVNPCPYN